MHALLILHRPLPNHLDVTLTSGAGGVLLDLTGETTVDDREAACHLLRLNAQQKKPLPIFVMIDAGDHPSTRESLKSTMRFAPDGVALRRLNSSADIEQLSVRLAVQEALRHLPDGATRIIGFAGETAHSVLHMASLRRTSLRLSGLVFAPSALAETLKMGFEDERAAGFTEALPDPVRLARSLISLTAKAINVPAYDMPFERHVPLEFHCKLARRDGFSGLVTSDPDAVPLINQAFAS